MRDASITLSLLRAASREIAARGNASSASRNWPGISRGQIEDASAIERRHPRSRGMHLRPQRPRATRPTFETIETISTAAEKWIRFRVERRRKPIKPKTIVNYKLAMRRLAEILGDKAIDELDQPQIVAALDSLTEGSRPAYYSAWRACLRWLGRPDLVAGIDAPKTRQRNAVLDESDLPHWNAAIKMAIARGWARRTTLDVMLFGTIVPMRLGEICSLRRQYVDLRSGIASLPDSKTGPRPVQIGQLGASILADRPAGEWFFATTRRGSACPHVTDGAVSRACRTVLQRYSAETGHKWHDDMTYHSLRHTWATHSLAAGIKEENLRHECGWSSAWVRDRYTHALSGELRREVDRVQSRLVAGLQLQLAIATS